MFLSFGDGPPHCKNKFKTFGLGLLYLTLHLEWDESLSTS